jgi:insertion element IS1 protein InsB
MLDRLKAWKIKVYYTDEWSSYFAELPKEKHCAEKKHTHRIESNNARQRHWFARFRRKALAVTKSLDMLEYTLRLFAHFHVNGNVSDIINPSTIFK